MNGKWNDGRWMGDERWEMAEELCEVEESYILISHQLVE
jgi:hypothetical protein